MSKWNNPWDKPPPVAGAWVAMLHKRMDQVSLQLDKVSLLCQLLVLHVTISVNFPSNSCVLLTCKCQQSINSVDEFAFAPTRNPWCFGLWPWWKELRSLHVSNGFNRQICTAFAISRYQQIGHFRSFHLVSKFYSTKTWEGKSVHFGRASWLQGLRNSCNVLRRSWVVCLSCPNLNITLGSAAASKRAHKGHVALPRHRLGLCPLKKAKHMMCLQSLKSFQVQNDIGCN